MALPEIKELTILLRKLNSIGCCKPPLNKVVFIHFSVEDQSLIISVLDDGRSDC